MPPGAGGGGAGAPPRADGRAEAGAGRGWAPTGSHDSDDEAELAARAAPPPEFYDAGADGADAAALRRERRRNRGASERARGAAAAAADLDADAHIDGAKTDVPGDATSDALLSCPACLETLCVDCQRHVDRPGQFRAMFVRSVRVAHGEMYRPGDQAAGGTPVEDDDAPPPYRPVSCAACGTRVAVVDAADVFHFFHVLESEC
eukprot:PRCOL_00006925-RA